jgi:hypothetical protein
VKALSIRQPWAWAILHSTKRVENRDWPTQFRGRVLLHASKGCTRDEYDEAAWAIGGGINGVPPLADLPRGAIVGAATITDCVSESSSPWFCGPYAFVLADVVALPEPIPCKGALGFWDVSEDVAARIRAMGRDHA